MTNISKLITNENVIAPSVIVGDTLCFTRGHMVLTSNGNKPIELISVGRYGNHSFR